jgi:hypothetical protein
MALNTTHTFGVPQMMDYFGGTDITPEVEARAKRSGWAGTAMNVVSSAGLPTMVPKVAGMLGGGPLARGGIRSILSGVEGGAVGGLQNWAQGESVPGGIAAGAIGGAGGSMLGPAINKGAKILRGIDDSVPSSVPVPSVISNVSSRKKPTLASEIDTAQNVADVQGKIQGPLGYQRSARESMGRLSVDDPSKIPPSIKPLIDKVINEDPATKLTRGIGEVATNKLALAGMGGIGFLGHPAAAVVIPAAMGAAGAGLKRVSAGGTRESMADLQRAVAGVPKYKGILSSANSNRLTKVQRQGLLEAWDE